MKYMKILTSLFIALLIAIVSPCYADISAGVVWEVRTTGNALNGGAYDLANDGGTDYSQQDAANITCNDLSSVGATATTITTAGNCTFTAQHVDNIIQISSGTNVTAGFYEIVTYTDASNVILDRAPDDGVGGVASGVGYVGGAIIHPDYIGAAVEAGNTVWIDNGTYVKIGAATTILTVSLQAGGTNNLHTLWEGYKDSRGDKPTGTDMPFFDCNDDTADGIYSTATGQVWKYLRIADCTDDGIYTNFYSGGATYIGLKITGCDDANFKVTRQYCTSVLIDCESSGAGDDGVEGARQETRIIGGYIHDNSGSGMYGTGGTNQPFSSYGSVYDANGDGGVNVEQNACPIIIGNIFINNAGAGNDGIHCGHKDGGTRSQVYYNNISMDNGDYGFSDAKLVRIGDYNLTNGNTTGAYTTGWLPADYDVTGSDATFIGGDDWTPASGSPALSVGFPGAAAALRSGLAGDYDVNIGPAQGDPDAGGAGGGETSYGFSN